MDCEKFKSKVFDCCDQNIAPEERDAFDRHLKECRKCSMLYTHFSAVLATIDDDRKAETPAFAETRMLAAIDRQMSLPGKNPRYRLMPAFRPLLVMMALIMGIFIGWRFGMTRFAGEIHGDSYTGSIQEMKSELFITEFLDEERLFSIDQ